MLRALTNRGGSVNPMRLFLAGVAFDGFIPFTENIQVRKSVVKNRHIILSYIRPRVHVSLT